MFFAWILTLFSVFIVHVPRVLAVESCTASASPSSVQTSTDTNFSFSVTNTGDSAITYVKIVAPSANFMLDNYGVPGWDINANSQYAELTGGTIAPLATLNFNYHGTSGSSEASSADWVISTNSGSGVVSCTGSLSTAISGVADIVAPELSQLAVSSITNASVTVSWTTSEAATSVVNYGLDEEYGTAISDATLSTTHTVVLPSLATNTTYYFEVESADATGNTGRISQNSVTTASVSSAGSVTITNTVTSTVTETATVTKTVILADTIKPVVSVTTKLAKAYAEAPIIEGKVVDSGSVNVGIVKISYSADGGKSWLLVDEPSGASRAEFSFVPEVYEDGNYEILVRAIDKSGNVGQSAGLTLIIDRLPPRIIHSLWRVGPIILPMPYELVVGVPVQVVIQTIGGVTELELILGDAKFALIKNPDTGLWENEIIASEAGTREIKLRAKDGGGNEVEVSIGELSVGSHTECVMCGQTSIYRYDELIHRFKIWNGEVYGQDNPSQNKNSWYLPVGKYYIERRAKGYKTARTGIFIIDQSSVVAVEGELEKWRAWEWWKRGELQVNHNSQPPKFPARSAYGTAVAGGSNEDQLKGKQIKWLEKTEWRGRELNLVVLPIWEPRLAETLSELREESLVVIVGSNQSSVTLLRERGGYKMTMLADPDGEILADLQGAELPIELMINRRGQVEGVE